MTDEINVFVSEMEQELPSGDTVRRGGLPFPSAAPLGALVPEDGTFSFMTINDLHDYIVDLGA